MNWKNFIILSGLAIAVATTAQIVLAEEVAAVPVDSAVAVSSQQPNLQNDLQWAWGEVTNLDSQSKTLTLKYLDYETDQEKDLVLVVDESTTFENIKDFSQLKVKDTLSIDYMIGADNRNIAKNISFEKPDVSSSTAAPAAENTPLPASPSVIENAVVATAQPVVAEKTVVETAQPAVAVEQPVAVLTQPVAQPEAPASAPVATSEVSSTPAPVASEPAPSTQSQPQ
ncbi:MAG: hypothetical protein NT014_01490 [Candidatus Omnitrophica bacterium]|nr:hypothetical protein [Candidatus Omnitrophota bacterium]